MSKPDPLKAIRNIEFKNFLTATFLFSMSTRMLGTLVAWWVYNLTKDPFSIGLIGLSEVIPAVGFALYAGHIIDNSEKKRLMLRCIFFMFIIVILFLILSLPSVNKHFTTFYLVGTIYFLIFCGGIVRAFYGPCTGSIVPRIFKKHDMANAVTWYRGSFFSASVLGHIIVGFLISFINYEGSMIVIVCLMFLCLFFAKNILPKPLKEIKNYTNVFQSVKEGLIFVYKTKAILGVLSLDLFAVLFGGAVALIPIFAADILKIGPIGFGWLNAAADFGAIIMIFYLIVFPIKHNQGLKMLFAVGIFGICMIVFALSKVFWISFIALLISGIADGVSIIIRGTVVQLYTPENMQGRVLSVNSIFINSSNELGQFESGLTAKLMGVISSVVFGGIMTLGIVVTTYIINPTVRKLNYD